MPDEQKCDVHCEIQIILRYVDFDCLQFCLETKEDFALGYPVSYLAYLDEHIYVCNGNRMTAWCDEYIEFLRPYADRYVKNN